MKKGRYAHVERNELSGGLAQYIRALLDVYEWETMVASFAHMMRRSCVFDTIVNEVGEHAIPYIFEQADRRSKKSDGNLGFGMAQHLLMSEITEIDPLDDTAVSRNDPIEGWAKFSVHDMERCWRQWAKEHNYIKDDDEDNISINADPVGS